MSSVQNNGSVSTRTFSFDTIGSTGATEASDRTESSTSATASASTNGGSTTAVVAQNVGSPSITLLGSNPMEYYQGLRSAVDRTDELKTLDAANPVDSLELMLKSVKGFALQFVEKGWKEPFDEVCNRANGLPESERNSLSQSLKQLRDAKDAIVKERVAMLKHVLKAIDYAEQKLSKVKELQNELETNDEGGIPGEISEQVEKALGKLRVSMRNFRYNFDEANNRDVGARRKIREFFSTTHTRLFAKLAGNELQWFDKGHIAVLKTREDNFGNRLGELLANTRLFPSGDGGAANLRPLSVLNEVVAQNVSRTAHEINEANRHFAGVSGQAFFEASARRQLQSIAQLGGRRALQLTGSVGIGVGGEALNGQIKGKVRHSYMLSGTGNGSITIEHVLQGGVGLQGKLEVGKVVKANAEADVMVGVGRGVLSTKTFDNVDSAVSYLTRGSGRLNPLLAKGRSNAENVTGVGHFFRSLFTKDGADFDERVYLHDMQKRGILKRTDDVLRRGRNTAPVETRAFTRIGGSGEVGVAVETPSLHFRFDASVKDEVYRDVYATKKSSQTYLFNIESMKSGMLVKDYINRFSPDSPPKGWLTDGRSTREWLKASNNPSDPPLPDGWLHGGERTVALLRSTLVTDEHKENARQKAITLLKDMRTCLDLLEDRMSARYAQLDDVDFNILAGKYHHLADACAAIGEFWDSKKLADGAQDADRKAFDELREELRKRLNNPGVRFPENIYQEKMLVPVAETEDGKVVNKLSARLNIDMFSEMIKNTPVGEWLGDPEKVQVDLFSLREGGRSVAEGVNGGVAGLGPLQGAYTFEQITTHPKTPGRRPWSGHKRTEVNLRLPSNVTTTAVTLLLLQRHLIANHLPSPETADQLKDMLKDSGIGMIEDALTNFLKDALSKADDKTMGLQDLLKAYYEQGKDVSDEGVNLQLVYEDKRLASISFGGHEKEEVSYGFSSFGPTLEFGYEYDVVVNEKRWLEAPSFDALAHICDDHLRVNNNNGLLRLAARNPKAFIRLFDIARKCLQNNNIDHLFGNADDADDARRFKGMIEAIRRDNLSHSDDGLRANWEKLNGLLNELKGNETFDDDMKRRKMVDLFTCISRHYQHMDARDMRH